MNNIKSWLESNSIKNNKDAIIKALEDNNFKDYNITANYTGSDNINLSYMGRSYRIEVDEDNRTFNLLRFNLALNKKHKNRYSLIKSFSGDNIILEVLRFIKNKISRNYSLVS